MLGKYDKKLAKFAKRKNGRSRDVTATVESNKVEARDLIRFLYPRKLYGNDGGAMNAAFADMTKKYKLLKQRWTHRRVRSLWDGNPRRVDSFELDALRQEKAIRDEAKTILNLDSTAAFLAEVDPDYFGQTIHQLRDLASRISAREEED